MPLLDAILDANTRFAAGASDATVRIEAPDAALPLAVLTCIDARLNHLFPTVLGLPDEGMVWLRNAGNVITGPLSSTMRSLSLACALKGAKEIALIGHTDCLVAKTTVLELTERFRQLGVERTQLPDNLNEFFGLFASERQNVLRGVEVIRRSPLVGPRVPVHGLLLDLTSRRLECLANGYQARDTVASRFAAVVERAASVAETNLPKAPELEIGGFKESTTPIGQAVVDAQRWLSQLQVPDAGAESRVVEFVQGEADELAKWLDKAARFKVIGTDQKAYGPVPGLTILKWIAEGRINWQAPAQKTDSAEWKPLAAWAETAKAAVKTAFPRKSPPVIPR
jgi:carbonic anhydrase